MKKNGMGLNCHKCWIAIDAYKEEPMKASDDKWRIKAKCPHCGAYIKWLAFLESNLPDEMIKDMENHNYARSYRKVL